MSLYQPKYTSSSYDSVQKVGYKLEINKNKSLNYLLMEWLTLIGLFFILEQLWQLENKETK